MTPHEVWRSWNLQPVVLASLVLAAAAYRRGLTDLWGPTPGRGARRWQAACFAGGLAALAVALVSPLDRMAEALLSAHMAQHVLLVLVAAPLLVLGSPGLVMARALPGSWRRAGRRAGRNRLPRAGRRLVTNPLASWVLAAGVLWSWHVPALYDAALTRPAVHALEHAMFLASAMLFWWTALAPAGPRRLPRGADLVYVFTGALQSGALGALLAFAATPIYPFYLHRTAAWGLTPLQDQQLAGMLMWVPPFAIYLAAAGALFVAWLRAAERAGRREDARAAGRLAGVGDR